MQLRVWAILAAALAAALLAPGTQAGAAPEMVLSADAGAGIERGRVVSRRLPDEPAQRYYLYVSESAGDAPRMLVTVHGISRNAREHIHAFEAVAERHGVVLVAPLFDKDHFPDFQRLGRVGKGARADLALRRIVADAGRLTGAQSERFYLYGHSGGAQFTHRYAMAHPEDVIRYAVSAAGWYTLPDPGLKYPEGVRLDGQLPGVTIDLTKFLRIPVCILVGERDRVRDHSLNRSRSIDTRLGKTRLERAKAWVEAMTAAARRRNINIFYPLFLLPTVGHDFTDNVAQGHLPGLVEDCLFGRGAP